MNNFDELMKKKMDLPIKNARIEDLHPFKQNLVKKYNIDINTYEGLKELSANCSNSIFLNYYADAELAIIKKFFEDNDQKEYSDEEITKKVCEMKLRFWYKFFIYPLDNLSSNERARIYNDFDILRKLYLRGVFIPSDAMHFMLLHTENFDFRDVADKYTTILNIKAKAEMDNLGLQSYIESIVPSLLELPKIKETDLNNGLILSKKDKYRGN